MKEEKNILKRCGKNNPYTVPEGYFDTLSVRVMANIPTEEVKIIRITPQHKPIWIKWTGLVAACMAGALICINVYDYSNQSRKTQLMSNAPTTEKTYDEQYQEEVLDYAMVDYNDVYNYLSGSEY